MKLTTNAKFSIALIAVFAVVLGALLLGNRSGRETNSASASDASVLRDDTHLLSSAPDNDVVLVEFLDFECEACLAMYPTMERIRAEYADRITFGGGYCPIPRPTNRRRGALVVEASSRQGKFVEMYQRMYDTQTQWGESSESQVALFRTFAQDLGLDMATFEADMNDPAVAERVEGDFNEGIDLGVQGTPTLFLNGVQLPSMPTYDDLTARIDAALAQ